MISKRFLSSGRVWIALAVFALAPLAGCDQGGDTQKMAPPQPAEQQKNEAEARRQAYGAKGQPSTKGGPAAKPDAKPAEAKPDEKK